MEHRIELELLDRGVRRGLCIMYVIILKKKHNTVTVAPGFAHTSETWVNIDVLK